MAGRGAERLADSIARLAASGQGRTRMRVVLTADADGSLDLGDGSTYVPTDSCLMPTEAGRPVLLLIQSDGMALAVGLDP